LRIESIRAALFFASVAKTQAIFWLAGGFQRAFKPRFSVPSPRLTIFGIEPLPGAGL
jgi:hypothetical protein